MKNSFHGLDTAEDRISKLENWAQYIHSSCLLILLQSNYLGHNSLYSPQK